MSEGDPLLVRLYVEALLAEGGRAAFTPNDLLTLRPDIKAFFDRWFDEQKKLWKGDNPQETVSRDRSVNGFLNACAIAKGPLTRDDVLGLAPSELPSSADLNWAADALSRFVIGASNINNGYVFGHSRLGYYFAERSTAKEREGWCQRYLRYGRETLSQLNDDTQKPKDASPYVVRYYGAHLSEANAQPQAFYDLMSEGWLRAWEWIDGTPDGFLADVQRAWQQAKAQGAPALGQQVRAALCFSSVVSLSANISTELRVSCVKTGVISPTLAYVYACRKPNLNEQAESLAAISAYVSTEQRVRFLAQALAAARAIQHDDSRVHTLSAVAERLLNHDHALLDATLEAVLQINRAGCLDVIEKVLPTITQLGGERALHETAQAILDTARWWP